MAATCELDATDAILCFLTFTLTESLGASLINHPATITHASIPKEEWEALEITDSLLRLSICIEKANDINQALKNLNAGRICALSPQKAARCLKASARKQEGKYGFAGVIFIWCRPVLGCTQAQSDQKPAPFASLTLPDTVFQMLPLHPPYTAYIPEKACA